MAALTRHFRDIDLAEEAFQDAAVRALKNWSEHGHPRDRVAWLIMTGRNATIDRLRRQKRFKDHARDNSATRDPEDGESRLAEEIDLSGLRGDVLCLMFMCCHEELPISDQLALALVVRPKAMEQHITRAKRKAAATAARLDTPTLQERTRRLDAVSAMVYLLFNEGYSAGGGNLHIRNELCEEAIRLARLLLDLGAARQNRQRHAQHAAASD